MIPVKITVIKLYWSRNIVPQGKIAFPIAVNKEKNQDCIITDGKVSNKIDSDKNDSYKNNSDENNSDENDTYDIATRCSGKYLPPKTQNGDQDHGWDNRDKNENEENDSNENDTYYIISHQTASWNNCHQGWQQEIVTSKIMIMTLAMERVLKKKNENDADFPTSHSILQYHIANSSLPIRRKYKKIKNKKDYSQWPESKLKQSLQR